MLQKMGWQEGSGLGKEQQGMTEHIKVKKLEDGAGVIKWSIKPTDERRLAFCSLQ